MILPTSYITAVDVGPTLGRVALFGAVLKSRSVVIVPLVRLIDQTFSVEMPKTVPSGATHMADNNRDY
jgi:hypothetical protein